MEYIYIDDTAKLRDFCDAVAECRFVAVDTEFMREKTYFPKLCLIQVAAVVGEDDDRIISAIIDPLSSANMELSPLFDILGNEDILKVFHAGKQDIEILYGVSGGKVMPRPVFDTQIAAMVCGFGEQIGYESIVSNLLGENIDKSQRFTDWSVRPLSDAQLQYAISDVTYLCRVYEILITDEIPEGRLSWIDEEMRKLCDASLYESSVDNIWDRAKKRSNKPAYLMRLKMLYEWREEEAIKRDIPRGWVLNDEALQEIALTNPNSVKKLEKIRTIGKHLKNINLVKILEILASANDIPDEEKPRLEKRRSKLTKELEGSLEFLRLLLKIRCEEEQVAQKLVADSDSMKDFLLYRETEEEKRNDISFMSGWRYELFGRYAERAVRGEIGISLDDELRPTIYDIDK